MTTEAENARNRAAVRCWTQETLLPLPGEFGGLRFHPFRPPAE